MSTTYTLTCGRYDSVNSDYPQYNTAMTPSGSFSTSTPLANNLINADIKSQVTSWSFSDGVITYDETNSSLDLCKVSTVSLGTSILVVNCCMGVILNNNTGSFGMNSYTQGDSFFANIIDSHGNTITTAQRLSTTFSPS